ncbi:DUF6306 domain-containing protein [Melaminivora sp.]|uniref:DUF6306 domain-containing protein n=1 Tax=Melaminivora sp. TaxID=1933032 RepID=UPI0028B194C1|nr:DUF6306 domain-containing protein [Melaminivora sp.]
MPASLRPTPLCDLLGCRLPLVLSGGPAGEHTGAWLAAVADCGAFGLFTLQDDALAAADHAVASARLHAPDARFGVRLAAADAPLLERQVDWCLARQIPAVWLPEAADATLTGRLRGAGLVALQQVRSARQALDAQRAGAQALLLADAPAAASALLTEVLALAEVPVAATSPADGAAAARRLHLGAQAVVVALPGGAPGEAPGPALQALGRQAASHLQLLAEEPGVEYASPVCYAPEFQRQRDAALAAQLDELLAAERAGARVTRESAHALPEGDPWRALLEDIHDDEVQWCGVLLRALRSIGATPGTRTGDFYGRAMAVEPLPERLAFLNRGQGWVARKVRELLADLDPEHEALRPDLQAMLQGHEDNLARVNDRLPPRSPA